MNPNYNIVIPFNTPIDLSKIFELVHGNGTTLLRFVPPEPLHPIGLQIVNCLPESSFYDHILYTLDQFTSQIMYGLEVDNDLGTITLTLGIDDILDNHDISRNPDEWTEEDRAVIKLALPTEMTL